MTITDRMLFPIAGLAALVFGLASAMAQEFDEAERLLARIAEPLFEAAEVPPELRFGFAIEPGDRHRAVLLDDGTAVVSLPLFLLAESPEELAAAVARLAAAREIGVSGKTFLSGFRFRTRPPSDSAYVGRSPDLQADVTRRSVTAAEDTLRTRSGSTGPSIEEIRELAEKRDVRAIELLRRAGLSSHDLLTLYRKLAAAGGGLFDRSDYNGRIVLGEQIAWLAKRTDPVPARTADWQGFDGALAAVRADLLGEHEGER